MQNIAGERALIAAIISRAIEDARSHRYPKPPHIATKIFRACNKRIKITIRLIERVIDDKRNVINKINILCSMFNNLAKLKKKRRSYQTELIAYEARTFFDENNVIFEHYCDLLDIDHVYMSQKANKYFRDYDMRIVM